MSWAEFYQSNQFAISDFNSNFLTSHLEIQAFTDVERSKRVFGRGFSAPINPSEITVSYENSLAGLEEAGINSRGPALTFANNTAETINFKLLLTDDSVFHYSGNNTLRLFNDYENDVKFNLSNSIGPVATRNERLVDGSSGEIIERIAELNSQPGKFSRDNHVAKAIERFLNLTTQRPRRPEKGDEDDTSVYLGLQWGRVFTRPGMLATKAEHKKLVEAKRAKRRGPYKADISDDEHLKFFAHRRRIYPCYLESVEINYTQFSQSGMPLRAELSCVFKEDSAGG